MPSIRDQSSSPEVIFGIDNDNFKHYWSSKDNEPDKYILISLKYPIIVNGIGMKINKDDLYSNYTIETTLDFIKWDSTSFNPTTIDDDSNNVFWEHYVDLSGLQISRFIKIIPSKPCGKYSINAKLFALYGLEFFGKILNPFFITFRHCKFQIFEKLLLYFVILI